MWDTIAIIGILGGLEFVLWYVNRREDRKKVAAEMQKRAETNQLLEDLLVTMSLKEDKTPAQPTERTQG